jgi:FkbM family methyltransferase
MIRRLIRGALRRAGYDIRPFSAPPEARDQFAAYARLGLRPAVVVDVGANLGATVEAYRARFGGSRLVAVEPLPHLAARLEQRYAGCPEVTVVNAAIDETCGTRILHNTAADGNSSFFEVSAQQRGCAGHATKTRVRQSLSVPTTTLDRLAQDCRIDTIDVLKLDIQGAELLALRGAADLLGRRRIRALYCEVLFAPIYVGQCQFHEVAAFAGGHGYWLYDLFGANHQLDGSITHANALFLSPEVPRGAWE